MHMYNAPEEYPKIILQLKPPTLLYLPMIFRISETVGCFPGALKRSSLLGLAPRYLFYPEGWNAFAFST